MADCHGRGYATEAARRVREFAYAQLGWRTLVSFIAPENVPSQRVAQRLGATFERDLKIWTYHRSASIAIPAQTNCTLDHDKETSMSVKIRLSRGGTKKRPYFYIVVAEAGSPRDGRYIEQIGTHNPLLPKDNADRVKLDLERVKHWLSVGAQPTDRVARFLDAAGLAKREAKQNPSKAKPRKKRLEREAAAAEAATKAEGGAAAGGEAKPAA